MRKEEARWMARQVRALGLPQGSTCLNLGSSTGRFRRDMQSHVQTEFIEPLERDGIRFIHCDIKADEGVDMVGDLLDPAFHSRLRALGADLVTCNNLLEHLEDPQRFALACAGLMRPGARLLVSVPYSYPYHPDPIDTLLRPSPDRLVAMFPGLEAESREVIVSTSYLQDSLVDRKKLRRMMRNFRHVVLPFLGPAEKWRPRAHRFLWLLRPYKVSAAVLLRREDRAGHGENDGEGPPALKLAI
ncbi:MAG: methyltransferase domain-containing protein [Geminicoccaceae bacterium]|nr:methyltransferase domain-containing protein [Geminicoccaceae bacterium]